ncbi:DUF7620 family protein [Streptomyces sp. DHE17-7]|uniref:DUF7620 family protein n=1 Tax=Streptomyces sp. DHE17-7 TaxID=2759949 RepID=UPI0022EA2195|nr:hypothetical protein [Streptomyces sp. DHE17-7]MBJ6623635.1 hypothetical protein [Streptomyces sp. DHE17-7]
MPWINLPGRRRKAREQAAREAAHRAIAEAREAQREIEEERRPMVLAIVHRLRVAREENHFPERIEAAYAARRGAV